MTNNEGFSLISVNTDEDEEIVIQAGVPQVDCDEEETTADELDIDEEGVSSAEIDEGQDLSVSSETDESPTSSNADSSKTNYEYVTTREDLDDSGPEAKTRYAVLGGSLLFVVGFAVYYAFLR